jgi:hypothetical protein
MIVTMHYLLEEGTAGELVDALQPVGEELHEEIEIGRERESESRLGQMLSSTEPSKKPRENQE